MLNVLLILFVPGDTRSIVIITFQREQPTYVISSEIDQVAIRNDTEVRSTLAVWLMPIALSTAKKSEL
jgi:hypothetical protein